MHDVPLPVAFSMATVAAISIAGPRRVVGAQPASVTLPHSPQPPLPSATQRTSSPPVHSANTSHPYTQPRFQVVGSHRVPGSTRLQPRQTRRGPAPLPLLKGQSTLHPGLHSGQASSSRRLESSLSRHKNAPAQGPGYCSALRPINHPPPPVRNHRLINPSKSLVGR